MAQNAFGDEQIAAITAVGFSLYQQGKLDDAATMFEGLTVMSPSNYAGFAGLGAVALAKEPPALDDAVTHLTQAAGLNPSDASVQANLGEALLRQGKLDEASKAFEKAMTLDPNRQDAGANRARAIINGLDVVAGELRKMAAASA